MSKEIKISNGTITIKNFCSRGLRKKINKELYKDIQLKTEHTGETKYEGFSMEAMDRANDVALVGMTEKIVIDGKEEKVDIETFDNMSDVDVSLIIDEINKLRGEEIPNV